MTHDKMKAARMALEALENTLGFTGSQEIDSATRQAITSLRTAIEQLEDAEFHSAEYWKGHDDAVRGVAKRWEEALTAPIPKVGVMNEPLESLYRRTEALRTAIEETEKQEPMAWVNYANLQSAAVTRNRGGQGDTHSWSETPTAYHSHPLYTTPPAAPVQEPVAWIESPHGAIKANPLYKMSAPQSLAWRIPLYTTPQPQQDAWKNAAIRLGEELSSFGPDGYYDMTAEQWLSWALAQQPNGKHSLPQSQREWVGLTDEEIALVCAECAASAHNWNDISFARAIEAKLKEKNGG